MQTKNLKKKGFTLVELVIVVAVIAVLSAILIPTIGCFVEQAKETNDMATVRLLNAALIEDGAENDAPKTMSEVIAVMDEKGYGIEKLTPRSSGDILWDSVNNRFLLRREKDNETLYQDNTKAVSKDYNLWRVAKNQADIKSKYSNYLKEGGTFDATQNVATGLDVGKNFVSKIVYTNNGDAQNNVIIRTNNGETSIDIDAINDEISHYGTAGEITVKNIAASSYHEFGSVSKLTATGVGRIIIENNALVFNLEKTEGSTATFKSSGKVILNNTQDENVATATSYDISTLEQLKSFRDYVNAGVDFSNLPVEIKADIDMSSESWLPIGTGEHPFNGEIRGNGHTLKGLTNGSIISTKDSFTTTTTKTYGAAYGLIAVAGSLSSEHSSFIVSDLILSDVNISLAQYGNCVGALLGYAPQTSDFADDKKYNNQNAKAVENISISKVTVSGTVIGNATVGGIAGKLYNPGNVIFENCTNNANVTAKSKAGGLIGYISGKDRLKDENGIYKAVNITLKNLTNNGNVNVTEDKVGGIVSYMNAFCENNAATENLPISHILVEKCTNTGNITGGKDCAGVGGILYSFEAFSQTQKREKVNPGSTVKVIECSNTGTLTNNKSSSEVCQTTPDKTGFGISVTNN